MPREPAFEHWIGSQGHTPEEIRCQCHQYDSLLTLPFEYHCWETSALVIAQRVHHGTLHWMLSVYAGMAQEDDDLNVENDREAQWGSTGWEG